MCYQFIIRWKNISHGVDDIIFNSFPCVKIGKLASDLKYSNIINFLIQIIIGIVNDSINLGVTSRFLIVDADIGNNPNINEIYEKNGFKYNETLKKGKNKKVSTISMRLDMFT